MIFNIIKIKRKFTVIFYSLNQIKKSQMSSTLDFACGLAAGWSQILTGQPLDFIKTKFQLSQKKNVRAAELARQILKEHGVLGFYRGSSSLFLGFALTIALQFSIYEACKKRFMQIYPDTRGKTPEQVLSIRDIFISGAIVGSIVSFIYCPVEYAKIQKQMISSSREGSLSLLIKEIKSNQFKNIYKGILPTFLRETIGSAFYYGFYEASVRKICELKQNPRRFAQYSDYLLAGSAAGLGYWTFSYPLDVFKTKIQSGQSSKEILKSFHLYAYRGISVIALRAIIVNGFSFATFEQMKGITELLCNFAVY